jgi:hypothetical protein
MPSLFAFVSLMPISAALPGWLTRGGLNQAV